jgi:hypothetical protein
MVCTFPLTVPIAQTQIAVAEWRLHYSCDSIALAKGHSQLSEDNYAIKGGEHDFARYPYLKTLP